MKYLPLLLALAVLLPSPVRADDDLSRDEVATFKKRLVAVLDALGAPPAGFVKDKDDFVLPTSFSKNEGKINAVTAAVSRRLAIQGVRDAERNNKQLGEDYQKKIMAAQMKGDYAEMARISQEMQTQGSKNAMDGMQAKSDKKEPIEIRVAFNETVDEGIDPDNIVVEKPGVLGLKYKTGGEDDPKETVKLFYQPALKDTKKLARLKLFSQGISVPAKTSVGTVIVELTGVAADVEAWAKRAITAKILAVIDAPAK